MRNQAGWKYEKNTEKEKRKVHKKDNPTNKRGASNSKYIEWA